MRPAPQLTLLLALVLLACSACSTFAPLPSWQPGESRSAITTFVDKVSQPGSADFVPAQERLAVFDNDGTLWGETPVYFQAFYIFDRIRQLAPQHPEWQTTEPYASVLKGDLKGALAGGEKALIDMTMATHAGISTEQFRQSVVDWIGTAKHPVTGRKFTHMVYQPMLELLDYLRAKDFKIYIVSGGGVDFMRAWASEVYGIPPENIIGTRIKTRFVLQDQQPLLMREPALDYLNDKEGKPVAIHHIIGRRPTMAFGNSDGDMAMLQWVSAGSGPRFGAIVHHTDDARESAYDRQSPVGRLDKALDASAVYGWTVIDMKQDWKIVYPAQP